MSSILEYLGRYVSIGGHLGLPYDWWPCSINVQED